MTTTTAETRKPGQQEDGTWRVPSGSLFKLRHRVEVLNRRVRKLGGAGLSVDLVREEILPVEDPDSGAERTEAWAVVRVGGEVPRVADWDFVARVEHHDGVGNIVSRAPGSAVELPESLRHDSATCDHCKTKRDRKDTFVLVKDGDLKRVGRNCLADFLRSGSPELALRLWSLIAAVESLLSEAHEEGCGGGAVRGFGTVGFLASTVSAIRHVGWLSKTAAFASGGTPTANTASWIAGRAPTGERAREEWLRMQPTEADYEEAGEVVAWVEGLTELNDYLSNLRVAVLIGHVERRHEGIVASGVVARRRAVERAEEAARESASRAGKGPSEFVGTVDKRYEVRGMRVTTSKPVVGAFGASHLTVMEDDRGNEVKTFLRGAAFKVGDLVSGKVTVSKHEVYRGVKQTMTVRCKLTIADPSKGTLFIPREAVQLPLPSAPAPDFDDSEIPF